MSSGNVIANGGEAGGSIWARLDIGLVDTPGVTSSATGSSASTDAAPERFRTSWLDITAACFWLAAAASTVFAGLLEEHLTLAGLPVGAAVVLRMLIPVFALILVAVSHRKRPKVAALYAISWPLVVLFWKLPRTVWHRWGWNGAIAMISALFSGARGIVRLMLQSMLWVLSTIGILWTPWQPMRLVASLCVVVLLAESLRQEAIGILRSASFFEKQSRLLRRLVHSGFGNTVWWPKSEWRDPRKQFTLAETRAIVAQLTQGLLWHRGFLLWVHKIESYRMSVFPLLAGVLSVIWLGAKLVWGFALLQSALFDFDPSQFIAPVQPNFVSFIFSAFSMLHFSTIPALTPWGPLAEALRMLNEVAGLALSAVVAGGVWRVWATGRQSEQTDRALSSLRESSEEFERRFLDEYGVTLGDAMVQLRSHAAAQFGVWLSWMQRQAPSEFWAEAGIGEGSQLWIDEVTE